MVVGSTAAPFRVDIDRVGDQEDRPTVVRFSCPRRSCTVLAIGGDGEVERGAGHGGAKAPTRGLVGDGLPARRLSAAAEGVAARRAEEFAAATGSAGVGQIEAKGQLGDRGFRSGSTAAEPLFLMVMSTLVEEVDDT